MKPAKKKKPSAKQADTKPVKVVVPVIKKKASKPSGKSKPVEKKPVAKPALEKKGDEIKQPSAIKPIIFSKAPGHQDEAPKHDLSKNLELYNRLMAGGVGKQGQQAVPEVPKPVFNPALFDPRSANEQLQSNRTSGLGGLQSVLNSVAPGAYAIRMVAKDGPNLRVEVLVGDHRFPLDPNDSYCFFSAKEFVKGGYVE
jgi:hypothetical protein